MGPNLLTQTYWITPLQISKKSLTQNISWEDFDGGHQVPPLGQNSNFQTLALTGLKSKNNNLSPVTIGQKMHKLRQPQCQFKTQTPSQQISVVTTTEVLIIRLDVKD